MYCQMIRDIALKKFDKLDSGSFVPHKGVTIHHKDGSSLTLTNAFIEKYVANDDKYIIVYTKNHGVITYKIDELLHFYEFLVAVPSTLVCVKHKKGLLNKLISWL